MYSPPSPVTEPQTINFWHIKITQYFTHIFSQYVPLSSIPTGT